MAKKHITFADEAKRIQSKYYKVRKPGEDQITDDAFNSEMEQLKDILNRADCVLSLRENSPGEILTNNLPEDSFPLVKIIT